MDRQLAENIAAWDSNLTMRAHDIESGLDTTYNKTIVPYVMGILNEYAPVTDFVLDIGSGCGFLTSQISKTYSVEGIDISRKAIEYSSRLYPKILFSQRDVCSAKVWRMFNFAVANMVINNLPDFDAFLRNINSMLSERGKLLIITPHPFFWAKDKVLDKDFVYGKACAYKIPFHIHHNSNYTNNIIYFHRSLEIYLNTIIRNNFSLLRIDEIYEHWKEKSSCQFPHMLGMLVSQNAMECK